jgi:CRISPR-associated endonuclease/helicase Cas3
MTGVAILVMSQHTVPLNTFATMFAHATAGGSAYPYQQRLATDGPTTSHLLNIPTGLGKTAAAVLSWIWRRRFSSEEVRTTTPRRLVYCLPMRVLAEQTYTESIRWLDRLGLLAGLASWEDADGALPTRTSQLSGYTPDSVDSRELGWAGQNGVRGSGRVAVHLLMGGEERTDWVLWPEKDAVLIGTQDMLLSRALNRGYASRKPRWPIEFGLLNNDCLWVFDEVQLMGPGLATGLQLEAFRNSEINGKRYFGTASQCVSWYLSATASRRMLMSREWRDGEGDKRSPEFVFALSPEEQADTSGVLGQRRLATKKLESQPAWRLDDPFAAERILTRHREMVSSLRQAPPAIPRRTLLICNTVDRARKIHAAICEELKADADLQAVPDLVLLHSRYRPPDRAREQERLKAPVSPDAGQIVVATQVVEAGVDLSSAILWTEVAPLPSIVQRLGRLNRAGEFGHNGECRFGWTPVAILVGIPLPRLSERPTKDEREKHERDTTNAYLPYDGCECEAAQTTLSALTDASPANLQSQLQPELETTLQPPNYSLQRHELLDFFDTDSNLSLGYTDVSPFVRGIDPETDLYLVWREWEGEYPPFDYDIGRQEICQVPIWHVIGKNGLSSWGNGFVWIGRERGWQPASRENVLPGATLLLPVQAGGYEDTLGWTGNSNGNGRVTDLYVPVEHPTDEDLLSSLESGWQSIESHTRDVQTCSETIFNGLDLLDEAVRGAIGEAILWHDYGKVIDGWQDATRQVADAADLTWPCEIAPIGKFSFRKSPLLSGLTGPSLHREVWRLKRAFAPRLRHEVASALALRQHHRRDKQEPTIYNLLAEYLVMSHHGHVRKTLREELPRDPRLIRREGDAVRGIREGAAVPAVSLNGQVLPATPSLSIACRQMGRGPDGAESWTQTVLRLLDHFGPFRLAYFEAIVRAADCRASANPCTGVIVTKPRAATSSVTMAVSGGSK